MGAHSAHSGVLGSATRVRGPLALVLDARLHVVSMSGDPSEYGFAPLFPGGDAVPVLPFLARLIGGLGTEHGAIETPDGSHAEARMSRCDGGWLVLVADPVQRSPVAPGVGRTVEPSASANADGWGDLLEEADGAAGNSPGGAMEGLLSKSRFVARLSHEFRTPLTSLLGYAERLARRSCSPQDLRDLHAVIRVGKHLSTLVNALVDHGLSESGTMAIHPRKTEVAGLLTAWRDMFAAEASSRNLALVFVSHPSMPPRLHLDELRVRQIGINLIGNALKFTKAGGITVALGWADDELHLFVSDTGPGVPEDVRERVFHAFSESARGPGAGAGLGLSISRDLARSMGGDLVAARGSDGGAEFRLNVFAPVADPAGDSEATAGGALPLAAGATSLGRRIIVAEDDDDLARLFGASLEEAGFEVHLARDGHALERAAKAWYPDAIISDLDLPGQDGPTSVRRARELGFAGPLLIVSGFPMTREAAAAIGADDVMRKPVATRDLVDRVRRLVERAADRDCL